MSDLPNSPAGVLRMMPTTAAQIGQFSKSLIENVQNGNLNPIEILVMLRALEAVSETVRDSIKSNIESAADKYSEKSFEMFGCRIEKSDFVRYDYTVCSDRDWEQFSVAERTAGDNRKQREVFLRSLKEPMDVYDKDSGETWTIRPPLKRATSGLKVFLK